MSTKQETETEILMDMWKHNMDYRKDHLETLIALSDGKLHQKYYDENKQMTFEDWCEEHIVDVPKKKKKKLGIVDDQRQQYETRIRELEEQLKEKDEEIEANLKTIEKNCEKIEKCKNLLDKYGKIINKDEEKEDEYEHHDADEYRRDIESRCPEGYITIWGTYNYEYKKQEE